MHSDYTAEHRLIQSDWHNKHSHPHTNTSACLCHPAHGQIDLEEKAYDGVEKRAYISVCSVNRAEILLFTFYKGSLF